VLGSLGGGRAARGLEARPRRWLGIAFGTQAVVLWLCGLLVGVGVLRESGGTSYLLIAALAACFGPQNATVRHVAPRDMTTTVLTLTRCFAASVHHWLGDRAGRGRRLCGRGDLPGGTRGLTPGECRMRSVRWT
jgi:hypothetical protein